MSLFGSVSQSAPAGDDGNLLAVTALVNAMLTRMDRASTFLGCLTADPASAACALPDGGEAAEDAEKGIAIEAQELSFHVSAIGIEPARMILLAVDIPTKHVVGASPEWQQVSRAGDPLVMEGVVPLGELALHVTVREGEQNVSTRRGPGTGLWVVLGKDNRAAQPTDGSSDETYAFLRRTEKARLGAIKIILSAAALKINGNLSLPLVGVLKSLPLDPPMQAMGVNALGSESFGDQARGLFASGTASDITLSAPAQGADVVREAVTDTFQFFNGDVHGPTHAGDETSYRINYPDGTAFALTIKPDTTPFKDTAGLVVPGFGISLRRL